MGSRVPAKEYVEQVMVRLDAADFAVLQAIQLPGEPRAHVYLRVAREAVLPPSIIVRYRKAPMFKEWLRVGPLSPIAAELRGRQLLAQGWEVEADQVPPPPAGA